MCDHVRLYPSNAINKSVKNVRSNMMMMMKFVKKKSNLEE